MDSVLHLLGIARKAGRIEVGEEPVGAAARARQAKVILTAADGADNSLRRAAHFGEAGKVPVLPTPYTKGGLGGAVCEYLSGACPVPVVRHGVNDEFGRSGAAKAVLAAYHLNAEGIVDSVRKALALKKG